MWPRETIIALSESAVERDFFVISDEIYEKIVYDGNVSMSIAALGPEIKKRTITTNAVSKTYSMTGWRIGYAAAEPGDRRGDGPHPGLVTSNPTSIAQYGAVAALTGPQDFLERLGDGVRLPAPGDRTGPGAPFPASRASPRPGRSAAPSRTRPV